jgi:hypothetical protein
MYDSIHSTTSSMFTVKDYLGVCCRPRFRNPPRMTMDFYQFFPIRHDSDYVQHFIIATYYSSSAFSYFYLIVYRAVML